MTQEKINIIGRRHRRLFQVSFAYTDAEHEYLEQTFYRASGDRLEEEIRSLLRDFANEGAEITWTFGDQDATKDSCDVEGYPRYLEVSAREIDSLEHLDIWEL